MQDNTLRALQNYLEHIRYNTIDFGIRLIKPFKVCNYSLVENKYKAIFDNENINDSYYITKEELDNFLLGRCPNNVNIIKGKAFQDGFKKGFYISLEQNKLDLDFENIELLFGLRFKNNDIFYKIYDVLYQTLDMLDGETVIDDNVKLYIEEDFHAEDFLEVNKFLDTSRTVTKGVGYSVEIDGVDIAEYVTIPDAKIAISMAKKDSQIKIMEELNKIFPMETRISKIVKEIVNNTLL